MAPHKYSNEKAKEFEDFCIEHFLPKEQFDKLKELLKTTGSVIAGGSVLKSLSKYVEKEIYQTNVQHDSFSLPLSTDLDIYIPIKHYSEFVELFLKIYDWQIQEIHYASMYDTSFFKKNGIQKRISLVDKLESRKFSYKSCDLMKVSNSKTVIDVVSNFDLTVCECWYNGEDIFSNYPEDIEHKIAKLKGDYINAYVFGNTFIENRISKYRLRGFTIKIPTTDNYVILDNLLFIPPCNKIKPKTLKERQKWLYYTMFFTILYGISENINVKMRSEFVVFDKESPHYNKKYFENYNKDDTMDIDEYLNLPKLKLLAESEKSKMNWKEAVQNIDTLLMKFKDDWKIKKEIDKYIDVVEELVVKGGRGKRFKKTRKLNRWNQEN